LELHIGRVRIRDRRVDWESGRLTLSAGTGSQARSEMKAYMCVICGYVYEEEAGDPESGIEPGTRWADVPLTWRCPDCGAGKEDFEMVEI
jgi:rubredoxin